MEEKIPLPPRSEYSITAENITLRLMIDREHHQTPITDQSLPLSVHTHAFAEIFVCISGSLTIATDKGSVKLSAGELAIVPAKYPHFRDPTHSDGIWHTVSILPIRRRTRSCRNLYRMLSGFCFADDVRVKRGCVQLCESIAAITKLNAPGDSCLPALDMLRILLKLSEEELVSQKSAVSVPGIAEINRFAQLEHIIDVYFMTDITVGDIAARLFISPRQLARIVKQRYGTTLHETIRKKRVTVAAKLLLDGNKTVEEIGHEVGFHSKSCFYRAFYAEFGETPLGYRKNAGNIPAKH